MATVSGRALARAALAGNPSDAYGGATLAVVVPDFGAEVRIELRDGDAAGLIVAPPSRLVAGTIERFAHELPGGDELGARLSATWATSIPREVGLGGSSALVTATLRALGALFDRALEPPELAARALDIETNVLGIAAGPQDRVAQAFGGLTYMDFHPERRGRDGRGHYEPLDPALLPPLYLAYREDAHAQSGGIHALLRDRYASGDAAVRAAMARLAQNATDARDALLARDFEQFGRCIDSSFDTRRDLVELDPRHVAMVERARSLGASANYTGSGGSIVGACRDDQHRREVIDGLDEGAIAAIAITPS